MKLNSSRVANYLSWILRGFLFFVSLFFMLFSFDVFSMDGSILQKVGGFFIHNNFTMAMLLILWIAWKRENVAGVLLLAMSIGMVFFFGPNGIQSGTWMMISLPFVVGVLFLANFYLFEPKTKA